MVLLGRFDRFDVAGRAGALVRSGARLAGLRSHANGQPEGSAAPRAAIGAKLRDLLAAAGEQDEDAGRVALLAQAVEHLVPDEARLLQALADRPAHQPGAPLVHIHCLTSTGLTGEPLLLNASSIGRTAGVAVPQLTSYYVSRLLALGLVEIGPEDDRLTDDYRALLGEPAVLAAMSRARETGATPRVLRHTLALSALGHELCVEPS
jgi:hypothetical protein